MKNLTVSSKTILYYRIIFAALSWFTIITSITIYAFNPPSGVPWYGCFNVFKSLTYQTNLIVTIWLTLAIIWYNKPESIKKFLRPLKGAFTIFITLTIVLYALLLQIYSTATGFGAFINIVLHYITPIAFIIDWVLTETELRYKWNYLAYWIIYPICYLAFTFIHGTFTGDYIYSSVLDINKLGILGYFMVISLLILIFIILGSLYIVVNRRRIQD